jgi:hypothetical protein
MARSEPPEPDFLITPLAARGEVGQLWGPGGIGKSMLVEACCGGVGTGAVVAGLRCEKGRVMYLDAENGEYEVHRRVRNLALPPDQVAIYDASSTHVVHHQKAIARAIKADKPDLLVLDSLRRLTPGTDENDSGDMAEVIGVIKTFAQRYELAVLLIHHARKDGTTERGSSAIKDQVSISWEMRRAPGVGDRHLRCLHNDKMRIAAEPDDLWLRIVWNGGVQIVAAQSPDDALPLATGPQRSVIAQSIVDLLEERKGSRATICKHLGRTEKDGTVRRALAELVDSGEIEKRPDGKYARVPLRQPPVVAPLAPGTPTPSASSGASGESVAPKVARKRT